MPEFGRVTGQMQYDLFHIYTVDAHTLQVLRNMRWMTLGKSKENFPFASKLINDLPKLEILYSNIFYKNLENDVLFINHIEIAKYDYDPKELKNILYSRNNIFNLPY